MVTRWLRGASAMDARFIKTELTAQRVITRGKNARLPVRHALKSGEIERFVEPGGVTPWQDLAQGGRESSLGSP
ncbi:MAG: hypothetical protein KTR19_07855 [Hyphomicrobiales bacterium]|nr:hypothetical protein [Hyphomicrobiales bacterium]